MNTLLQDTLVFNYNHHRLLIESPQIGIELFRWWNRRINTLYDLTCSIKNSKKIEKNRQKIYDLLSEIYQDLIGEVNGHIMRSKADLDLLLVAYNSFLPSAENTVDLTDRQRFRHKVEYLFAREIIVQRLKSERIMADENEDIRLMRRYNTKAKRNEQRSIVASSQPSQQSKVEYRGAETTAKPIEPLQPSSAPIWDRSATLYIYKKGQIGCHIHNHKIISATAVLLGRNNSDAKLNVEYCTQCEKFFMSYTVYESYRHAYGMILGNLRMDPSSSTEIPDIVLSDYSPLKLCGYSVSQQVGYSTAERQYIISKVIDLGILKKNEVIRYLEHFINMNGKKAINAIALDKWKQDLEFTLKYKMSEQLEYQIRHVEKY